MVTSLKRPKRPTAQQLEDELMDLRVSLANTAGQLEVCDAQRVSSIEDLDWALRYIAKVGGYMAPEDFKLYRTAVARMEGHGLRRRTDVEIERQNASQAWLASKERG